MPAALVVSTMPAAPVVLAAPVVSAALSEKMHVANDWERGQVGASILNSQSDITF